MHIIYFTLCFLSFIGVFFINAGIGGVIALLLLSGIFLFLGTWNMLQGRIEVRTPSVHHVLSPDELRQIREKAEQVKVSTSGNGGNDA